MWGYYNYKRDDGTNNSSSKKWNPSREEDENNNFFHNTLDEQLHTANRENISISKWNKFPIFLSFFSLIAFLFMHFIDLFCYALGLYYDGNGVPFA